MKEKFSKGLKWFFNSYIWLGLLLLIIDIVTKNVIVANRQEIINDGGKVLIKGFLRINYIINNNLVFGLDIFKNELATRIVFSTIALLVTGGIIFYLIKKWDKVNRFYRACLFMIIAGAIGNVIDRIFFSPEYLSYIDINGNYVAYNGVVDWIDFYGIWGFNFNIADSAVVVAAFMLIIYMIVMEIIDYRKKKKSEPKVEEDNTKVLSKTEQEKNKYLEDQETKDE